MYFRYFRTFKVPQFYCFDSVQQLIGALVRSASGRRCSDSNQSDINFSNAFKMYLTTGNFLDFIVLIQSTYLLTSITHVFKLPSASGSSCSESKQIRCKLCKQIRMYFECSLQTYKFIDFCRFDSEHALADARVLNSQVHQSVATQKQNKSAINFSNVFRMYFATLVLRNLSILPF